MPFQAFSKRCVNDSSCAVLKFQTCGKEPARNSINYTFKNSKYTLSIAWKLYFIFFFIKASLKVIHLIAAIVLRIGKKNLLSLGI